jgi:hypothetical protein
MNVTAVSRDQMHMNVHSVLSSGSPNIDADVVAVWRMICGNSGLCTIEQ